MLLLLAFTISACGGAAEQSPATPTGQPVTVKMSTKPSPPALGQVELIFKLTDDQGQPLTGATARVIADHSDISGLKMEGEAADQGDGKYALIANFAIPGNWKLVLTVNKENLNYKKNFKITIK
jgi:hypothetical protein